MDPADYFPSETFWQESAFRFIRPEEMADYGIDPDDIPIGTVAALKHPVQLASRFGGNAYGSGLFEVYNQLGPHEMRVIQQVNFGDPQQIARHYKELNEIYTRIGLLIRFSRTGQPFYLIPVHLIFNTLLNFKSRIEEIGRILEVHLGKYPRKHQEIGIICFQDDLILHELSFRFREHHFVAIDSLRQLRQSEPQLDLVLLTRDLYEILLQPPFTSLATRRRVSRQALKQYALHILWKIYARLNPQGEILVVANHHMPSTSQETRVTFKTEEEAKNFLFFTHVFRTRRRYELKARAAKVNVFDFQKYLSGLEVAREVRDTLLKGRTLQGLSQEEIQRLPYMDFRLGGGPLAVEQERIWAEIYPVFFDTVTLKTEVPRSVRAEWDKRFACQDYEPRFAIVYLGQKKGFEQALGAIRVELDGSHLTNFSTELVAEYKDAFEYVIATLKILDRLRKGHWPDLPQNLMDRLRQPLWNRNRRHPAVYDVIRLMNRIPQLERLRQNLNPDRIEGERTPVLANLEALFLFGFTPDEVREIVLIVLGHSAMGRILAGKMNEKALQPLTEVARGHELKPALNLLRYCRMMTMAETQAARRDEPTPADIFQLFDLYEKVVRVVTDRSLDWDRLLDENIASRGGITQIGVEKLLRMMNRFQFLDNWAQLPDKGPMEKETLADFDPLKLARIEEVITLVSTIAQFEGMYLREDPLQLPLFYRKFFDIEFHGTGHLFEKVSSPKIFVLLWITVNILRDKIVNFNPLLGDAGSSERLQRLRRIEEEIGRISTHHLDLPLLKRFSDQLYNSRFAFIVGTGFLLRINAKIHALEVAFLDLDQDIDRLEYLLHKLGDYRVSQISKEDLATLEQLFANLEQFFQSHLRLLRDGGYNLNFPSRQLRWFNRVSRLRKQVRSHFLRIIFVPQELYTNLARLYRAAPSLLHFVLPELELNRPSYLTGGEGGTATTPHLILAAKKFQALIQREKRNFYDLQVLHRIAQEEFGPLATGIVGVSDTQIEKLEDIAAEVRRNTDLFEALVKALIFQNLGAVATLRKRYAGQYNPADDSQAGAFFLDREHLPERYGMTARGREYLRFLVRHLHYIHHIIRGELSFYAVQDVVDARDKQLFDAFFIQSFIMMTSAREDLILEDLAGLLLRFRGLCHRIIDGETTPDRYLSDIFVRKGKCFLAYQAYQAGGLPEGMAPASYLDHGAWDAVDKQEAARLGRQVFALERLLRLEGIRRVEFRDLVRFLMRVPLKFVYNKRKLASTGYATFEREILEAQRIFEAVQCLPEASRALLLQVLAEDRVRIFGYEQVARHLNQEARIKLLLIGLAGILDLEQKHPRPPLYLNFGPLGEKIDRRFDTVNHVLDGVPLAHLTLERSTAKAFLRSRAGIHMRRERQSAVLSVDFRDHFHVDQRVLHMDRIADAPHLKAYYERCVRHLKRHPFYTGDYQTALRGHYAKRLAGIKETMLAKAQQQFNLIVNFEDLHAQWRRLARQTASLGFDNADRQRLQDLYGLRKNNLKRDKLSEWDATLGTITNLEDLNGFWGRIKVYLQRIRPLAGKEFETLVARKFDAARTVLLRERPTEPSQD